MREATTNESTDIIPTGIKFQLASLDGGWSAACRSWPGCSLPPTSSFGKHHDDGRWQTLLASLCAVGLSLYAHLGSASNLPPLIRCGRATTRSSAPGASPRPAPNWTGWSTPKATATAVLLRWSTEGEPTLRDQIDQASSTGPMLESCLRPPTSDVIQAAPSGRSSTPKGSSRSSEARRSRCSAAPTRDLTWAGPTRPPWRRFWRAQASSMRSWLNYGTRERATGSTAHHQTPRHRSHLPASRRPRLRLPRLSIKRVSLYLFEIRTDPISLVMQPPSHGDSRRSTKRHLRLPK